MELDGCRVVKVLINFQTLRYEWYLPSLGVSSFFSSSFLASALLRTQGRAVGLKVDQKS